MILIALILIALPRAAGGTAAATPKQILCDGSYVVIADIVRGTIRDCRLQHQNAQSCTPTDTLVLSISVGEVLTVIPTDGLGSNHFSPRSGDIIQVSTGAYNQFPNYVGGAEIGAPPDEYGTL